MIRFFKKKFVYLHIPKTAGSAVKEAIEKSPEKSNFIAKAHAVGYSKLSLYEKCQNTIITIREPVSWYLSMYNFKIHSESDKGYSEMENNSLNDFISDVALAENGVEGILRWNKPLAYKQHVVEMVESYFSSGANLQVGFLTVNLLFYGKNKWYEALAKSDIRRYFIENKDSILDVKYVLRQEFLQEDFERMIGDEALAGNLNKRVNAMPDNPYRGALSDSVIKKIQQRDSVISSLYYS